MSVVVSSDSHAAAIRPVIRHLSDWGIDVSWRAADLTADIAAYSRWLTQQERAGTALLLVAEERAGELAFYAAAVTGLPVVLLMGGTDETGIDQPSRAQAPVSVVSVGDCDQAALCVVRLLLPSYPSLKPLLKTARQRRRDALHTENLRLSGHPIAPESRPPPPAESESPRAESRLTYSAAVRKVIVTAGQIARGYACESVRPVHLLAAILDVPECAARAALELTGHLESIAGHLVGKFAPESADPAAPLGFDDSVREVLAVARAATRKDRRACLTSVDLLSAIAFETESPATDTLWESGLTAYKLRLAVDSDLPDECDDAEAEDDRKPAVGAIEPAPSAAPPEAPSAPPRDVSPHASGASGAHLAKAAAAAVARAEEMIRQNRRDKAEELLSTALRLEPENSQALRLLDELKQGPP